jgi:hypothetical protein
VVKAQEANVSESIKDRTSAEEEPSPSVSDLKKNFSAGSGKVVSLSPSLSPTPSQQRTAPVLPMVKPLLFSATGMPPTSTLLSKPGTEASALKGRSVTVTGAGGSGAESGETREDQDVKPASGSVKQAIAALRANAGPEAVQTTGRMKEGKGREEEVEGEEEEEKIDAFAFWKGK